MSSELRLRRGNQVSHDAFVGAVGEVTYNTETKGLHVHDGVTAGGLAGGGYKAPFTGAQQRTQRDKNTDSVSVKDFGAIGDGTLHTVAEWIPSRYATLAAVQTHYPHVTSTSDSIDWAAIQQAANTANIYKLHLGGGAYHIGSNEIIVPAARTNIIFLGSGAADTGATTINATPNKNGYVAITAKCYAFTMQDIALVSTTGNADGFAAIGLLHMRDITGSTGRLCHRNLRISGFSKHACKIGQAISYQFDNIAMSGGVETLWIGRDASVNQRSTTVSAYHAYITSGARCGVYLDRPSDFMADRLILESCGKGTNPNTSTYYTDAAGIINQGTGQCQLNSPYFEDNRRNIWADSGTVIIAPNYGPATLPDVFDYIVGAADDQKGRVELYRTGIKLRYLLAEEYKGYIEVGSDLRFNQSVKFNIELIAKTIFVGSSPKHGRVDGLQSATINSNMSAAGNVNVIGQELRFGVTNSSVATTSKWITLGHRRLDTTYTALGVYVNSGTTSYEPDGTAAKIAEFNGKLGLVVVPKSSSTPEIIGEMVFEATSNTQLKIKLMGTDGVVRSATLTLA
jgi:hypothetical protein